MKATALIRRRVILAPDAFAEVPVWPVPQPVLPLEHPYVIYLKVGCSAIGASLRHILKSRIRNCLESDPKL